MKYSTHALAMLQAVEANLDHNIQVGHTTAAVIGAKGYPGGEGMRFAAATLIVPTTERAYRLRKLNPGLQVVGVNHPKAIRECNGAMVFDAEAVRYLVAASLDIIAGLEAELRTRPPREAPPPRVFIRSDGF